MTTTSGPPVGEPISRYSLQVGDCFNVYESIDVTTRVPCEMPHDREVFHAESHPAPHGEPYPGDREMQRYALQVCYQQFEAFAGILYELSRLDIGAITPTKENFEDARARYRGITCYVQDTSRKPLVGSMRGRGE
ncbi:MAG TPA: septum formation family protein [Acidimicrobiales bacterium]